MKKKLLIIISILFLLVAGVMACAPLLIKSQKVQKQILARINNLYVIDASVQNVILIWFPFPHVKVEQIEVLHQNFSASIPQATLYPTWKMLFDISSLGRLHIIDPVFRLNEIFHGNAEGEATTITLPDVNLQIKNGTLHLPAQQNPIIATQKILLKNISAGLVVNGKKGEFSWQSEAGFARKIDFSGEFLSKGKVVIKGEVRGFSSSRILTEKGAPLLTALDDVNDVSFSVTGNPAGLHVALQGDIPDLALSRLDSKENFMLGKGDLNLYLGPQNTFSLKINDLVLHEPQLRIRGEIARYFTPDVQQENIKIDLQAEDIDLSAIRRKVLSLLGDNSVAQLVCDIVQRGRAHSASYFFDAPVKSFEDVASMTIEVDIADSDIHLKDIPLDLRNAQGPIIIKDGDLTGKNITTWVGDAKGTAGVFLVGLSHDKHGLEVDVDIDANLMELPAVLRTLIPDQDVVYELGMVQGSGRAQGHLHIGDDLRDFNVVVDVGSYHEAELRYERLSWPLRLESGILQVTDSSITWQDIKAEMASHSIQESSGHVAWDDQDVPLSISSLHGFFDTNTFLGELKQYPVLKNAFADIIDTVQGSLEVTGTLSGPFFKPQGYTYSFDATLKDVAFKTPALPEKVMIEKGQVTVGHQLIHVLSSSGSLFGQRINLIGELEHEHWQGWKVNLQANGFVADHQLNWLASKDVFPTFLTPRPLYRVANMNIHWDEDLFGLNGQLYSADETTSLHVDIENKDATFAAVFQVKSPTDEASFSLKLDNKNESFSSSFKGNLSEKALDALLDKSSATFSKINGDFKVHKTKDKKTEKTAFDFQGAILGHGIQWAWGKDKRIFTIPALNLVAENSLLTIKELKVAYKDESLAATGVFSSKPGIGHFEVDVVSPSSLTTINIGEIQDDFDHFLYTTLAIKKEPDRLSTYQISGLLNFNLDQFILPFGSQDKDIDKKYLYKLPFTPLKGTYQFNKTDSELNLQYSNVCGVGINGQLTWQGPQETSKEISMLTPADKPLKFEEFLSCFNFDSIIEGPLNISGRIYSDTKLCTRGGLLLSSEKGTIKKFVALSKILSLINITGLSGAIWTEGFYYNTLGVTGNICDNIFTIDKAFIDGDGVDVVATGDINLSTMEYDLTVFVVPFATITGLVTKVPLVGRVLGGEEGRIVSIPAKVTGPLHDPNVTVLSPSAIGEATGKWILDTITLPFDWMLPEKIDKDDDE